MKSIPPTLQAKLDGGVTTLSRCWTVTRKDGTRLGFTEHDETLMLNGIAHEPDAGLSAGALESVSGLASMPRYSDPDHCNRHCDLAHGRDYRNRSSRGSRARFVDMGQRSKRRHNASRPRSGGGGPYALGTPIRSNPTRRCVRGDTRLR